MKLPAGLMDRDCEFFLYRGDLMILHDSKIKSFEHIPASVKFYLEELLSADKDACFCLDCLDLHETMDRLRQFVLCRFSSFDLVADITEGGNQHPEYTICDKRGLCPYEGTLCNALSNHGRLTGRELQVIQIMAKGLPNKLIADDMGISINTVSTHIQNIEIKLQLRSKREILLWAIKHNVIDDFIIEETESVCGKLNSAGK